MLPFFTEVSLNFDIGKTISSMRTYFLVESQEYEAADFMVRDTWHDITELRNCPDCYKHSNEKGIAKWFALPCRDPHALVWAKQKGYPYWPAKVGFLPLVL